MRRFLGPLLAVVLLLPMAGAAAAQSTSDEDSAEMGATVPSGRLVFTSDRVDENMGLWVLEASSSEPVRITTASGRDRSPAVSPDGRSIVFASDRDNPDGITARGSNLRWYDLFIVSSDGSNVTGLLANRYFNHGPTWSPDGSTIAFYGEARGEDGLTMQIFTIPADGSGGAVALTDDPVQATSPTWSPDGTQIAFATLRHGQNEDGSWNREIYVMDATGGNEVRLTDDPASDGSPAWSPDGRQIAFSSDRAGNDDIYVMDASGGDPKRLTVSPESDSFPTWSPDGTMIAFVSNRDGDREIYIMSVDGSGQVNVTRNPSEGYEYRGIDDFPAWGP